MHLLRFGAQTGLLTGRVKEDGYHAKAGEFRFRGVYAIARLIHGLLFSDHITDDPVISFRWMRVPDRDRVKYEVAVLAYRAVHSTHLDHSSALLTHPVGAHLALLSPTARRCPRFVHTQSATGRFRLPPPKIRNSLSADIPPSASSQPSAAN